MAKHEAFFEEVRVSAATSVLTGGAWLRDVQRGRLRACVNVRVTVPSSGGDPEIEILGVRWGEITGHDSLEVAHVASEEALRLLREDRLVTKSELFAAYDWHLEKDDDGTCYLASPSLQARVFISWHGGHVDHVCGCLIKSGNRYVSFRALRSRRWMDRVVIKALLRLAMRASRKPHATDGELDEAA